MYFIFVLFSTSPLVFCLFLHPHMWSRIYLKKNYIIVAGHKTVSTCMQKVYLRKTGYKPNIIGQVEISYCSCPSPSISPIQSLSPRALKQCGLALQFLLRSWGKHNGILVDIQYENPKTCSLVTEKCLTKALPCPKNSLHSSLDKDNTSIFVSDFCPWWPRTVWLVVWIADKQKVQEEPKHFLRYARITLLGKLRAPLCPWITLPKVTLSDTHKWMRNIVRKRNQTMAIYHKVLTCSSLAHTAWSERGRRSRPGAVRCRLGPCFQPIPRSVSRRSLAWRGEPSWGILAPKPRAHAGENRTAGQPRSQALQFSRNFVHFGNSTNSTINFEESKRYSSNHEDCRVFCTP